jgi:DNA-binding response OmpR family regulator
MVAGRKILIVDCNIDLRETLKEQLEANGEFIVEEADSGCTAIEKAGLSYYDLVLVDFDLTDISGCNVCRTLRKKGVKSPIVMLSCSADDADTILGLDSGANDYIVKPFRINVLMARLRARIREAEQSEHAVFQIGPYSFRPLDKTMYDNHEDRKIRLTEKETAIVKFLYLANDPVVSRDVLLGEVWGYNANVTTHTLETHVYRLRQKIEKDPSNALILITESNGYRIVS